MAPYLEEAQRVVEAVPVAASKKLSILSEKKTEKTQHNKFSYEPGRTQVDNYDNYAFEDLRPYFPDVKWEALKELPYTDKGLQGSENFKDLLEAADDVFDLTPKIGTEISGIDLANLTEAQMNDLARLLSVRGAVFVRNQTNFDIEAQRKLHSYWGTLHKHATTAVPKRPGCEDVHVVYMPEDAKDLRACFGPTFQWHSDVSYELQPLAYTSLKLVAGPPRGGGGDTHWSSQYAAYDQLSPAMQKYLESLTALHSADMQANDSIRGGRTVRRDPVTTTHPLIRVHPVTGWKSLFFNPGFVTKIVGIPKVESDHIISYLSELVATTQENHCRFAWGKNDVALWDNRICDHTASYGFAPHRRHAVRMATQGETPRFDPAGRSQEDDLGDKYGIPPVNKDCTRSANYND